MTKSTIFLLIFFKMILSYNTSYQQTATFQLISEITKNDSIQNFFISGSQTYQLQLSNSLKSVNRYEPQVFMEDRQASSIRFGEQKSIARLSDGSISIIKSYQYPEKRIQSSIVNQSSLTGVKWFDAKTVLISSNKNNRPFLGAYITNKDIITFTPMNFRSNSIFNSIYKLEGDDFLAINNYYSYVCNSIGCLYYIDQPEMTCVKIFTVQNTQNNTISQFLFFRSYYRIYQYRRQYNISSGTSSWFKKVISFRDISFNCAYTFIDQNTIFIFDQSSNLIFRSLAIEDTFITNGSGKLIDNSIQIKGSNNYFIFNGILQQISSYGYVTTLRQNATNMTNHKKAWITPNNQVISINGSKIVGIQHGTDSLQTFPHIFDCQYINGLLFMLNQQTQRFIVYDYKQHHQLGSISLHNYSISRIRLQTVQLTNDTKYCLLVVQQIDEAVMYQIWDYTDSLVKLNSFKRPTYEAIIIPSQKTFYIKEDPQKTTLTFYPLQGQKSYTFTVPRYKWIRVLDTVMVLYLDNDSKECYVYHFHIDFDTDTVFIQNADIPIIIKLDKMSSNVKQNSIFLLKDQRSNQKPKNFILYFQDNSQSYFYNTLNPILRTQKANQFMFNPSNSSSLPIKPQILQKSIYYVLPNNSFVRIQYVTAGDQLQTSWSYKPCNFGELFKTCTTVKMKFLELSKSNIISLLCSTAEHDIIALYDPTTIMGCNINNRIKLMVYNTRVKDYDINDNGDIVIISRDKSDYFDYYQAASLTSTPIMYDTIVCKSNNGLYIAYTNNETKIYINDVLTSNTFQTDVPFQWNLCAIDSSGSWYVAYRTNLSYLQIHKNNVFFRQLYFQDIIIRVEFAGDRLLILTAQDLFYYNNFITGDPIYLIRNVTRQVKMDFNERYIIFSILDDNGDFISATICQFGRYCSSIDLPIKNALFRIDNDGKVYFYNRQNSNFEEWTNQIQIERIECSCRGEIIGWSITGGILLIIIVGLVVLYIVRKKKRKVQQKSSKIKESLLQTNKNKSQFVRMIQNEPEAQIVAAAVSGISSDSNKSKKSNFEGRQDEVESK